MSIASFDLFLSEFRNLHRLSPIAKYRRLSLPGYRFPCWHIAPDPARNVVPATLSRTIEPAALTTETDCSAHP
jgi:hypothetical protein